MSDAAVYSGMYLWQHAVSVHRKGWQGDDLSLLPKWHYLHSGKHCHGHQAGAQGEPERFPYTGILLCPIIEGGYRLEDGTEV